ncbi:MAG TPA: extensin family protein [Hyphomicrobiaceae bacterium]|nr:extensin family protein [Hyphomicrobiaceae bacterium]
MSLSCVRLGLILVALGLASCSQRPHFIAKDEPWRADEERACLASGIVRESRFVAARSSLGGPSVCGAMRPFTVSAAAQGWVQLRPTALLRCPMVPALDHWVQRVVMPAARYYLGAPVVELKVAASYSCRPMNHVDGARLSEHGHANAVDIGGFVLADGRVVTVATGWWGAFAERNFLRAVHRGGCSTFTTVLGPGYDRNHRDHFHLDLARHGADGMGRICK